MMDDGLPHLAEQIGKSLAQEVVRQLRAGTAPVAPEFLSPEQAAALIGYTRKALERLRQQPGKGPPFYRPGGGKTIRYRADDLRAWIESGGPVE